MQLMCQQRAASGACQWRTYGATAAGEHVLSDSTGQRCRAPGHENEEILLGLAEQCDDGSCRGLLTAIECDGADVGTRLE
jgi:hypothetical protein